MGSPSTPREFPYTNDVGIEFEAPEKPPLEEEPFKASSQYTQGSSSVSPNAIDTRQPAMTQSQTSYVSPITPASSTMTPVDAQPPPFDAPHLPHAITFPTESVRKLEFERFTIPTITDSLSSGFPYDKRLYDLISPDEWHLFSSDIVNAAKLSLMEDAAAWTTGITTGTLSSPFIFVLGPVAGYYAGKAVHKKTVVKVVKERLHRDGDIRSVLRRWNDQKFIHRGFQGWLELPVDGGEITVETAVEKEKPKKQKKAEKKIAKRFRIAIIPNSESIEQIPSYPGPGNPTSPVSFPLLEAPGIEHRELVELGS